MKKVLISLLAILVLFNLTACGADNKEESFNNNDIQQKEEVKEPEQKQEEQKQEEVVDDDYIVDGDEIIEIDDSDNLPPEGPVVVEKVINCDGCVFAYFSDEDDKAKKIGSTLIEE